MKCCPCMLRDKLRRQLAHSEKSTVVPVLAVTTLTDSSILVPSSSFSVEAQLSLRLVTGHVVLLMAQKAGEPCQCCLCAKRGANRQLHYKRHTLPHMLYTLPSDSCVLCTSHSCRIACCSCLAKQEAACRACQDVHVAKQRGEPYPLWTSGLVLLGWTM